MNHSNASTFPYIDPPVGFTVDPCDRIAYVPRSGAVYSIWTPDWDAEVMVAEEVAGGHSLGVARDLRDDLDVVVVALGGHSGGDGVTTLALRQLMDVPARVRKRRTDA